VSRKGWILLVLKATIREILWFQLIFIDYRTYYK